MISKLQEQVLSSLPDGVTVQDQDFNILYQNAAMIETFGSQIGGKCYEVYERRDQVCEGCGIRKVFRTGLPSMVLRTGFEENGSVSYWENNCFPLFDDKGNIIAGVEVCRNITDRVSLEGEVKGRNIELGQLNKQLKRKTAQLQSALAERRNVEERLKEEIAEHKWHKETLQFTQFTVDNAIDEVIWADKDMNIIYVNDAICKALGYTRQELLSLKIADINPNFPRESWPAHWEEIREKKSAVFESTNKRKDETLFPIEISLSFCRFKDREYTCAFIRDISERKHHEATLLEKVELEQRLSRIAANIPGFLFTFRQRPDGHCSFPFVSAGIRKLHGLAPEDVADDIASIHQMTHPEDRSMVEAAIARTADDLTPLNLEFRVLHPEKGQVWVELRSLPERMPDGGTAWYGIMTDVTRRKDSEQQQKQLMAELEQAYQDLKAAQNQIVLQDKMACIGQLAAGVAHEMNTPIGFVASNFETLNKYMDKFIKLLDLYEELTQLIYTGDRDRRLHKVQEIQAAYQAMKMDFIRRDTADLFQESKEGLRRVTNIVQNLRDFSRVDQTGGISQYDLNDGIKATLTVARNEIKYHANVITDLIDIPLVPCNSGQINQVMLNILVNATQAIGAQEREDRGSITFRTALEESYVVCQISDDGPGMPPEVRKRIFEPFFTTKAVGKGTGLGLSISYDIIVNKHHGILCVDSEVGKGTTFTIKLPLSSAEAEATAQEVSPQAVVAR